MSDYRISSTYIRLMMLADASLVELLDSDSQARLLAALEKEFLSGAFVNQLFKQLAGKGVESLALRFGSQLSIANHGPAGFAAVSAPDLYTALAVFAEYADTRTSASTAQIVLGNERLDYLLTDTTGNALAEKWLSEATLLAGQNLIETIMAHSLGELAYFEFAYNKPNYSTELEKLLHAPCYFSCEQTKLSIPATWARIPSPLYDLDTYTTNLTKSRELKLRLNSDRSDARHFVKTRLLNYFDKRLSEESESLAVPNLDTLADELCMSTRSLIRHLANQNTSYKEILNELRLHQAQELLQSTHLTINQIAYRLGYVEAANFSRAFQRWTGISPGAWRRGEEKK